MSKRNLTDALGKRVRQLRLEKGLTLERLAWEAGEEDDAGLTKGYLSKIERGQQLPSLETLRKLAERLEVDLCQLLVFPAPGDDGANAVDLIRHLAPGRRRDLVIALKRELAV